MSGITDMTKANNSKLNFSIQILSFRSNGGISGILFVTSLLHIALAKPTTIVEKGFPVSDGHYVNLWAPQVGSAKTDQVWFMTKHPGTNITMTASIKGGCNACPLVEKSTRSTHYEIEQPNKWYELKVMYTAKYGASTVNIETSYFYPKRQNKEVPPSTIRIDSTSDLYWTKLNPDDEPFFQHSSVECQSAASSGSGIQLKLTTDSGFELDLITLASLGVNGLLLLILMVTVCYYKQKVKAEVTLRKSKEDSRKVTYRQSMDPASFITNQEQIQSQTEGYDTYQNNYHNDNIVHGNGFQTTDSHQYQGQENKNFQE